MEYYSNSLARLIEYFERLPGIGKKTAQRLAFYVLSMPEPDAQGFAQSIVDARRVIKRCVICQNITDNEKCPVCTNMSRDLSTICVVEDPRDIIAIEKTHEYKGMYHVLHGVISPLNGIGPDDLTIRELVSRMDGTVLEVIMATNPNVEGETTAMYMSRLLKPMGIKVTRLAYGIPVGSELEYADEVTLTRAIEGRREI